MVIYRVIHKYKTDKHFEIKEIGVFDSYKINGRNRYCKKQEWIQRLSGLFFNKKTV